MRGGWLALGELVAVLLGLAAGWYFLVYRDPVTGRHGRGITGLPRESGEGETRGADGDEPPRRSG
ncbi:hypothetical protein E3C22_05760 [Jiella endophytica]|uniref:Uncharacterized protein n=1 Tax=Jiella endophytica TaxID=2558362 RepID=A0A4Y8RMM8_9HYPH|nr:hypothetical protein [Jiella endophytica]TFF24893.1 hypothetical protein E3C22_05760 [Jiella endophytica]